MIIEGPDANLLTGHNSYNDTESLTRFTIPTEADLEGLTHQVFVNNDVQRLLALTALAQSAARTVAILVKLGDPSKIEHVFLIVKKNRSKDQVPQLYRQRQK